MKYWKDMTREQYIVYAIDRSKREIFQDIQDGTLPIGVETFSDLHSHVDANCYGGFCEDDAPSPEKNAEVVEIVQCAVHDWLAAGRPAIVTFLPTRYDYAAAGVGNGARPEIVADPTEIALLIIYRAEYAKWMKT